MRVKMVGLYVKDPIAAHKFYTETLGFKTHTFMPEHQLALVVAPNDPDGVSILLEPYGGYDWVQNYHEEIKRLNLPGIVFGVPNVQEEYERLKGLGVNFIKEPTTNDWGTEAVFDDTCGNFVQIHQDD